MLLWKKQQHTILLSGQDSFLFTRHDLARLMTAAHLKVFCRNAPENLFSGSSLL